MQESLIAVGVFIAAFLLGSVPWGLVVSKFIFHTDIRQHGSGNIGTTNAMRTLGKAGGALVFMLDFGKGLASGAIAMAAVWCFFPEASFSPESAALYDNFIAFAFLGCVWGHIFSPWLKFKGGKGIAVAVGCLFVTFGVVGALAELAIFIVLVVATRYVSVGSIASAAACPFFALYYFWGNPVAWACCTLVGITVIWAHRANIARLRAGTENRIKKKKELS